MNLPVSIVRADAAKTAHIDEKFALSENRSLVWRRVGDHHFQADVKGGAYVVRRVDSRSRVRRQRYRWKSLWVPQSSPNIRELALEKRMEWAKAAAQVHRDRVMRSKP